MASPQKQGAAPDSDPDFAPDGIWQFLTSERHRFLIRQVEKDNNGFWLRDSQKKPRLLAGDLTALLQKLPADLGPDDVTNALRDSEFDGLAQLSWGLLLSSKFLLRFAKAIKRQYKQRLDLEAASDDDYR